MTSYEADPFHAQATVVLGGREARVARLKALEQEGLAQLDRLPYSVRVLLENQLRHCGNTFVREEDVLGLAGWRPVSQERPELPFLPARVLLQDFTGVPCVVDLAAMRSAVAAGGGEPTLINPIVPVDLVIDHSLQVDHYGSADAQEFNAAMEMRRNVER
jgi:aconitate hydratase